MFSSRDNPKSKFLVVDLEDMEEVSDDKEPLEIQV